MSTCKWLDLQTLGSQSVMPKNLLDHCLEVKLGFCKNLLDQYCLEVRLGMLTDHAQKPPCSLDTVL